MPLPSSCAHHPDVLADGEMEPRQVRGEAGSRTRFLSALRESRGRWARCSPGKLNQSRCGWGVQGRVGPGLR